MITYNTDPMKVRQRYKFAAGALCIGVVSLLISLKLILIGMYPYFLLPFSCIFLVAGLSPFIRFFLPKFDAGKRKLTISVDGITCAAMYGQRIPWSEIESFSLVKKSRFLIVCVTDNNKYLKSANLCGAKCMRLTLKHTGGIVAEPLKLYSADPNEILGQCNLYKDRWHYCKK